MGKVVDESILVAHKGKFLEFFHMCRDFSSNSSKIDQHTVSYVIKRYALRFLNKLPSAAIDERLARTNVSFCAPGHHVLSLGLIAARSAASRTASTCKWRYERADCSDLCPKAAAMTAPFAPVSASRDPKVRRRS